MNPAETTPLNARALHFRWQGHTYDGCYLTCTWRNFAFSGATKTPLLRVMPAFVSDRQPSERAYAIARHARFALAAAVVVWFSQVRAAVPLLAPALLLYALVGFARCLPRFTAGTRTRVLTRFGDQLTAIPHLPALEGARQRFEEGLLAAVRAASEEDDA